MNVHEIQEVFGKVVAAEKSRDDSKALRLLDQLLLKAPTFVPGWNQRGALLERLGCSFDAILNYNQAIACSPHEAHLYCNRGASRLSLGEYQKALEDFDEALQRAPAMAKVWNNKGNTYRSMVRIPEALKCYREAVIIEPDYPDAHLGISMCLLELGEFNEGWHEFEWRFKCGQMPPRGLSTPVWEGQRAKTPNDGLLIYGEQGYGDVLQFVRYVKFAKERWGGPVYVETRLPLMRLVQEVEGVDGVVVLGTKIPVNVTHNIAMMSVPAVVGTERGFMGAYLKADAHLGKLWDGFLGQLGPGLKVGICWAGQNREEHPAASAIDARRSLTLQQFAPVANTKGVVWASLQKGTPSEQVKAPPAGMRIGDFTSQMEDFYDTAALVSRLDLVITVDTAVAHLAAGLGVPTWMLSRFDGCWRWMGDRPDSPWYPTLRQFRQPKEGDWETVIEQVWRALQAEVAMRRQVA